MITIKFYEVGDAYDAEGRGPYQVIGRFTNEKDAKDYAKKRGNYNADAQVTKKEFVVAESLDEHLQAKEIETAQKILSRLNHEEKEALKKHFGLKEVA